MHFNLKTRASLCFTIAAVLTGTVNAEIVTYDLNVSYITVNHTGCPVRAIGINGKSPGPTIEATEGDTLRLNVHNDLDHSTSLHWHGILLPAAQDGVPYLNTPPIEPGTTHTFEYKVIQYGTYWYHSHTGLQEQRGSLGSMVFHPKDGERVKSDKDYVLVLADWNNTRPHKVLSNLKRSGEYYALKKGSVSSWVGVFQNGGPAFKQRMNNSFMRMGSMDLSDIGYDAFLANGTRSTSLSAAAGEKVRVRVVNAAASTYFNLTYAGGDIEVIAADGNDVVPYMTKVLPITNAETFDILVSVPQNKSYELRATSNDVTGFSSTYIGNGEKVAAPSMPVPNLYVMHAKHNKPPAGGAHAGHGGHAGSKYYMPRYAKLKSPTPTTLPANAKWQTYNLKLTGDMDRYVWSMNDKTLREADKIMVKEGNNVRFVMCNSTMMSHPMHLHGHFFRVLNGQGEYSPLKHTVDVPPSSTVTIEFAAEHPGDWFFHCHNLYHMDSGMERFVSYVNHTKATQKTKDHLDPNPFFYSFDLSFMSNMTQGVIEVSDTRNIFTLDYDYNYEKRYEVEIDYAYALHKFVQPYIGVDFDKNDKDTTLETTGLVGARVMLPLLIASELRINHKGRVRLQVGSDLQLTSRVDFHWYWNTDHEYQLMFNYAFNERFMLTGGYYNFFKWGAGVRVKF